ncbi:MAG TPA: hypothetical protein VGM83_19070 [Devosiaceae bacterium]|jgi:hypothetical protein
MIRTLNVILTLTSVAALVGVYSLKNSVEGTAAEKTALERTISRQESDLSMLKADWAYLNQPSHIEPIVDRHLAALNLQPLKQTQVGSFNVLPMRPPAPDTAGLTDLLKSLESGVDPAAGAPLPEGQ